MFGQHDTQISIKFYLKLLQEDFDLTKTVKVKQMIVLLAITISCLYLVLRKLSKTREIMMKLS